MHAPLLVYGSLKTVTYVPNPQTNLNISGTVE